MPGSPPPELDPNAPADDPNLGVTLAVGTLAGGAAFADEQRGFVELLPALLVGLICAAGALAHVSVPSVRRPIRIGLGGGLLGIAVLLGALAAPAYLLPYPSEFRDLLVSQLAGAALAVVVFVYLPAYLSSYLGTLVAVSALRWPGTDTALLPAALR